MSAVTGIAVGELLGGRYRIDGVLGAGGMSTIYEATDLTTSTVVAVKVLDEIPEGIVLERFRREADAAARLTHPNVVRVLGSSVGAPTFLVMERLRGRSLGEEVQFLGKMAAPRAARIAYQLLDALSAAHAAGIIHRDVKPSNVMLISNDHEGDIVKVLDFGIAKVDEGPDGAPRTRTGEVLGTIAYMPPEQAMGLKVDARADLYGAGAVLYYLLSARRPIEARTVAEVVRRLLHGRTQSFEEVGVEVPAALAAVVTRALRKAPEARFQSAREMADALAQAEPGATRPAPPPPQDTSMPTLAAALPADLDAKMREAPPLLFTPATPWSQGAPSSSSPWSQSPPPSSSSPSAPGRSAQERAQARAERHARRAARARREKMTAVAVFVATVAIGLILALVGAAVLARSSPTPRAPSSSR